MSQDEDSVTPELRCVLTFLSRNPSLDAWPAAVPLARESVQRLRSNEHVAIERCLAGEGAPAVVIDAFVAAPALRKWSLEFFRSEHASAPARANDRAPARHADQLPGGGGPQRSLQTTLGTYIETHVLPLPATLDGFITSPPATTPFYLNGWRAFVEAPSLAQDLPQPSFALAVDNTVQLLEAVDLQLFGQHGQQAAAQQQGGSSWCRQVDLNLTKLFIGPPGTISRLHHDAGEAHGWLGQLTGRKLFVLYPPSDAAALYPLASETETVQSPVEPLQPLDVQRWPKYAHSRPLVCIVRPGEALLVPQGWWHYAVALDRSITVQRNFYHAGSNASGLVRMVLKTAKSLRKQ